MSENNGFDSNFWSSLLNKCTVLQSTNEGPGSTADEVEAEVLEKGMGKESARVYRRRSRGEETGSIPYINGRERGSYRDAAVAVSKRRKLCAG